MVVSAGDAPPPCRVSSRADVTPAPAAGGGASFPGLAGDGAILRLSATDPGLIVSDAAVLGLSVRADTVLARDYRQDLHR